MWHHKVLFTAGDDTEVQVELCVCVDEKVEIFRANLQKVIVHYWYRNSEAIYSNAHNLSLCDYYYKFTWLPQDHGLYSVSIGM